MVREFFPAEVSGVFHKLVDCMDFCVGPVGGLLYCIEDETNPFFEVVFCCCFSEEFVVFGFVLDDVPA